VMPHGLSDPVETKVKTGTCGGPVLATVSIPRSGPCCLRVAS
jgi:hypothetical protein